MLINTMTTILILAVIVLVISLIVQHNRLKQSFTRYSTLLKRNDDLKAKEKQLRHDKYLLKKKANINLSVQQMKPAELTELIDKKNLELQHVNSKLANTKQELIDNQRAIAQQKQKLIDLSKDLVGASDEVMYETYGLYRPRYDCTDSEQYKEKLKEVRRQQKDMIKQNKAGLIFSQLTMDGSIAKGKQMQKKNIKQLIRSFNVECEAAINKVTVANISRTETRIKKSFEQLNKLNEPNCVKLSSQYLNSKLDEAHICLEYAMMREKEKEEVSRAREQEREEKKAQAEYKKEQAKYEKDQKHFAQAQALIQQKMAQVANGAEMQSLKQELAKLQAQINKLETKKKKLKGRAENPKAGYVYIISNIGSFGKNVYKIGTTRRLNPMERINELSSASVPFKFDVHALIFTNDAFKLENELHNYFDKKRINKVNKHKEFFRLNINEIKQVLAKHKDLTFDFHEVPACEEYRDTLKIEQAS